MYHISIEDVRKIFGWEGNLKFIPDFFAYSSYILIIYGISFFVGKDFTILNEQKEYPNMLGKRRNIGISLLLFVITLGIYFPFWLFRTVKDLKTNFDEEIPYTPGKAVGYLFIPLINFVWVFYILFSLPLRIKQIESKFYNRNIGFYFHPVFYSVLLILFSLLNELSFFTKFDKSTYGYILSFYSITIVIWLTIQAKLNSFYDFKDEQINSILKA
jgi:hypothetical protein